MLNLENKTNNRSKRRLSPKGTLIFRVLVNLFIIFALVYSAYEKYPSINESKLALTIVIFSIIGIFVFVGTTMFSIYKYTQTSEST